jgi:hypothetical protein
MTGNCAGITPQPVTVAVPYGIPEGKGAEVVPGRAGELLGRQCIRCGAVGTHYLTCPGLRLPSGYRLSDAPGPYGPIGSRGRAG